MKMLLSISLVALSQAAFAGPFDGSPLDPRSPVSVCQSYVSENYGTQPKFLAACGKITTRFAYKCVENISEKTNSLSVGFMNSCSFVNNKETLSALEGVTKSFPINNELLVAISFADTSAESTCIRGLANRLSEISVGSLMKCNQETLVEYGVRWAKIIAM
jgi:hypothetical protein